VNSIARGGPGQDSHLVLQLPRIEVLEPTSHRSMSTASQANRRYDAHSDAALFDPSYRHCGIVASVQLSDVWTEPGNGLAGAPGRSWGWESGSRAAPGFEISRGAENSSGNGSGTRRSLADFSTPACGMARASDGVASGCGTSNLETGLTGIVCVASNFRPSVVVNLAKSKTFCPVGGCCQGRSS
jgi:hypothetical protein